MFGTWIRSLTRASASAVAAVRNRHTNQSPTPRRADYVSDTISSRPAPVTSIAGDTAAGSTVRCEQADTGNTVLVHGAIDMATREDFVQCGADLLKLCLSNRPGPAPSPIPRTRDAILDSKIANTNNLNTAILDMGGVRFIDATGLAVLVALSNDLRQAGMQLRLRHASPRLQQLSTICDLDTTLGLVPT